MKIGILTLPLHINYGGILQAYALQTVLERMGNDVVVYQKEIKPLYKLPIWKYPLAYSKRILQKLFVNMNQPLFVEQKQKKEFPLTRQYINRFIQENIHTVCINKPSDINLSEIDCIIIGSDQIWRPFHVYNLFKADITDAFLKFANGWKGKRIAYATSFGVDYWEYSKKQTQECKELIKLFDAISVREESAIKLCADNLGIKVEQVLDPTLLLDKEDYMKFVNKSKMLKCDRLLFGYILDATDDKQAYVNKVAFKLGLKPFFMGLASANISDSIEKRTAQPVEKWLRCFYDAEFIVTDSFHGCIFSIIFNKPFIAIGNPERGMSRFTSLLSMFGLESRLVSDINDVRLAEITKEPYDIVNVLREMRGKSLNFLNEMLTNI